MAKYRIAWMPGDGIGIDVWTRPAWCSTGWGWTPSTCRPISAGSSGAPRATRCRRAPSRYSRPPTCALFGAITSKPNDEAARELAPALAGQGLRYRSPIVRLRQMFDLYCSLRPCRAYPGNPLNYRDGIDLVVFRENTEGLYAGVEFRPLEGAVRAALEAHSPGMAPFKNVAPDDIARLRPRHHPPRRDPHRAQRL